MVHTAGGNRFYGYNAASSVVKVSEDGLVTLVTPACDVGQGAQTIVAQICAEELGVTLDDVVVITDDTDLTPYDLGSWGSRVTWVVGQAAQVAARNARQQIFEAVATELEVSPDDLVSEEGWIGVRGAPDKGMPFPSAVDLSFKKRGRPIQAEGKFVDEVAPESMDWDTQSPNFASAAHAVEVEVDPDTGKVRVLDFKAAHGIGLAINPMAAEGQIEGSVSQGVGFGLMEELIMDGGKAVNPNFADYKIPSFLDLPRVDAILVENADPDGPFGAAGIGEPGLVRRRRRSPMPSPTPRAATSEPSRLRRKKFYKRSKKSGRNRADCRSPPVIDRKPSIAGPEDRVRLPPSLGRLFHGRQA